MEIHVVTSFTQQSSTITMETRLLWLSKKTQLSWKINCDSITHKLYKRIISGMYPCKHQTGRNIRGDRCLTLLPIQNILINQCFLSFICMVLLRTLYLQMSEEASTHAEDIRKQMEEPENYMQSYLTPMCHMMLDWTKHYSCSGKDKKS